MISLINVSAVIRPTCTGFSICWRARADTSGFDPTETWATLVARSEKPNLALHFAGFDFFSTHMTQAYLRHSLA
jgi:hypothetical protein